jgi:hypothetical protein
MTAPEIIEAVRSHGGNVKLEPDGYHLTLVHRSQIPDELAAIARDHVADLRAYLGEFTATSVTDTIARVQRVLFPPEAAPCSFHCGHIYERCKRCGAPLAEHYT